MKHYLNVCDVNGSEVEPVDVIAFGSPCQNLSVAGKREGLDGDRSSLFYEAIRIIKEMREQDEFRQLRSGRTNQHIRPRFAVWENVPGAFSSNKGEDFRIVLEKLARIKDAEVSIPMPEKGKWKQSGEIVGDGWSIAWRTLDAQYHGVPQRRRRIFLVADFADECAGEILFECQGLPGYPSQSREKGQGTSRDSSDSIGKSSERECIAFEPGLAKRDGSENRFVENCTPTIRANMGDNQTAVAYGICSYESNSMKSNNPHSGIYEADTARTLDLNGGNPACNQGGICICEPIAFRKTAHPRTADEGQGWEEATVNDTLNIFDSGETRTPTLVCEPISIENHPNDSRMGIREDGTVQTLTGRMGTGGGNVPLVAEPKTYGMTVETIFSLEEDKAPTLKARDYKDPQAVCYQEKIGSLCARDYKGIGSQYVDEDKCIVEYKTKYIVRRLTPTECARLQGMPDLWCRLSQIDDMSDEDYEFWKQAHKTYAEINGKKYKEKTKQQMITWYNKLQVDSAEYKAYGNGMALPCVRVPIHGIAKHGAKTMASLFDGIGGFPLAGLIDGIKTLWTSEIELFPIAVTMERFLEYEKYGCFTFGCDGRFEKQLKEQECFKED